MGTAEGGHRNVVISQPMYFAWPGFFELMSLADVFIWLDDARPSNSGSFTTRVQVKLEDGSRWMSIPVERKTRAARILDLEPATKSWATSHRDLLRQSLKSAPHSEGALTLFDRATAQPSLVDCLLSSVEEPARTLGVLPPEILRSSRMGDRGRSWRRVLSLVKAVGGTRYVTAHGSSNYLDHEEFERQGVDIAYMDYSLTPWPQSHGDFTPYVTVLDLIAATGSGAQDYLHPRTLPWRTFLDGARMER